MAPIKVPSKKKVPEMLDSSSFKIRKFLYQLKGPEEKKRKRAQKRQLGIKDR